MAKRLLEVLLAFAEKPVMNMVELTERVGVPQSTAFRLVRTLRDAGLLTTTNGIYQIGPRILQLAEAAKSQFDVVALAGPEMERLADRTGEPLVLTALAGDYAVAVHTVAGRQAIRFTFNVGHTYPLHAGASAKILFAFLGEAQRERILRTSKFERRTPQTTTDPKNLRVELTHIRNQGYAITAEEWEKGALAIAAPIFGPMGTWGLSLVGPTFRLDAAECKRLTKLVIESARIITGEMSAIVAPAATPSLTQAENRSVQRK